MTKLRLRLEAEGKPGEIRLAAIGVEWAARDAGKPPTRLRQKNPRAANALLEFFVRYKLWCLNEGYNVSERFEVRGRNGSLAQILYNLIMVNARRPDHWMMGVFGQKQKSISAAGGEKGRPECRVADLIQIVETSGEFVASIAADLLHHEDISIIYQNTLLDEAGTRAFLPKLLNEMPAKSAHKSLGHLDDHQNLIDLRYWRPPAARDGEPPGEGRVTVYSRFAFRQLPDDRDHLTFYCATLGKGVRARCTSHSNYQFFDITDPDTPLDRRHLARQGELKIALDGLDRASPVVFEVEYEYIDAYTNPQGDWDHVHVVYPTDRLTFLLLFPNDKPCTKISGIWNEGHAAKLNPHLIQPCRYADGHLVYWQVRDARPPQTYEIRWTW